MPDPVKSARLAGLVYVTGREPGITRRRAGAGFIYIGPGGKPVRSERILKRIRSLVIPPAWTHVWICASAAGHLQATGRDARGRKQYRYHPDYRSFRDRTKFGEMIGFGSALPAIRKRVSQALRLPGLPRNKVLAAIVRLLDLTHARVGNEEYAKENKSFGLTTLRNRHVQIAGRSLRFRFRGKSGQMHELELDDPQLARIVKQCHDLPGYELFEYLDEEGKTVKIHSQDVNEYLHEITGQNFTAKDFRTWAGTSHTIIALETLGPAPSKTRAKRNVVAAIKQTSAELGNRPAACKRYYIHPMVLETYTEGRLCGLMEKMAKMLCSRSPYALHQEELAVLELLTKGVAAAGGNEAA